MIIREYTETYGTICYWKVVDEGLLCINVTADYGNTELWSWKGIRDVFNELRTGIHKYDVLTDEEYFIEML